MSIADDAQHHRHHAHHALPTSGRALDGVALSATLHCLTGCAIGEVLGMLIGTALGWSNWPTIALAVLLAFFFGYALTSLPLLRSGLSLAAVIPIALASDTLSIATMEIVDNAIMLAVPGAMEAGVATLLFWGSLSAALVVAGAIAFPVNRWLIARGKGHAAVHETGVHGGPPPRLVAAVALVAGVFGAAVLIAEAVDTDPAHGGHEAATIAPVRGLAVTDGELRIELATRQLAAGSSGLLRFAILGTERAPIRDFEVEHERRMHLIVVRRDLTGFQHLHPSLGADGVWKAPLSIPEAGSYRVFADFKREGRNFTLGADLAVDGDVRWVPLPAEEKTAEAGEGYRVELDAPVARPDRETELRFTVLRNGSPVEVEPYLGAGGHLVALRQDDLAFLHVHPADHEEGHHGSGTATAFMTSFPSEGRYRLFLQFKHEGIVRTAAFTRNVFAP